MSPVIKIFLVVGEILIALAMLGLTIHLFIVGPMLAAIPTTSMAFFMGFVAFRDLKILLAKKPETSDLSPVAEGLAIEVDHAGSSGGLSALNLIKTLNRKGPILSARSIGSFTGNNDPKTVMINGTPHVFTQPSLSFPELTKLVFGTTDVVPVIVCHGPNGGRIRIATSEMPNVSFAIEESTSFEITLPENV